MHALDGLNPRQLEAVQTVSGPLLILAGPGSGKTRVIVHRIAYLVEHEDVHPGRIVAVTFTNRAAREMRERLDHLIGRRAQYLTVGTFHATCARWLRIDGHHLGLDPHFTIFDDNDQVDLVKRVARELEIDERRFTPRSILNAISAAKSRLVEPHEYARQAEGRWQELVASVYRHYQNELERNQALDFDDLLLYTVRLLQDVEPVRERYQERYLHLLVDEFQDTNPVQYQLVKLLGGKHRNVCVVGDPDQNIYSWRHAEIRNIFAFQEDFPELKVVVLEQNYRSTQTILDVAHAVISENTMRMPKRLWTENPRGPEVVVHEAYDERDEALFVVREIERRVARGAAYADFAVMYRTNAQSRALEEAFSRYRPPIPYRLVGGVRFYERREVKDILAYLRLLNNSRDTVSLQRIINVPSRGLGYNTRPELGRWPPRHELPPYEALERLATGDGSINGKPAPFTSRARVLLGQFVQLIEELRAELDHMTVAEVVDAVLGRTGYGRMVRDGSEEGEERWANLVQLRAKAAEYDELEPGTALPRFLEEVSLVQDVDNLDASANAVTLITLHAAKGLEFPCVFILGLEEGLCPHVRSMDSTAQMEEERRLFFVGITRAMRDLYLLYAYRRGQYGGEAMESTPSRFLSDIPEHLVRRTLGTSTRSASALRFDVSDEPPITRRAPRPSIEAPRAAPAELRRTSTPSAPTIAEGRRARFRAGQKVRHNTFGLGIVVASELRGGDEQVTVAFEGSGLKKLSLAFAKLEPA